MGEKKANGKHYVDNRAFTAAVRTYQQSPSPSLLADITIQYFTPLAEGVANNWNFYYSEHEDLTQEGIAKAIEQINHPNAARHAFNFFTHVMRNRMIDVSRSDSNRADKTRKHEEEWNSGFHREHSTDLTHETPALDAIADAIINGDGTTREGRASIVKLAAETGLSRQQIQSYLEAQKERLAHLLRPSMRTATAHTAPQPTPIRRYIAVQTVLPLDTIETPIRPSARDAIKRPKPRTLDIKYLGMWGAA